MGCTTSSQNTTGYKDQNSEKRQPAGGKSENGDVPAVESVTCTADKTFQTANIEKTLRSDSSINLHQESLEGLTTGDKREKSSLIHEDSSHEISNYSKRPQKKSKELNQVMAWGKKITTTENSFLQDLRLHRETATASDSQYEKEYETTGADETSRFIEGAKSDESSMNDLLNDLPHHTVEHRRVEHEESFDASKIIDVEKFRAANATEKNKISNNDQDNGKLLRGNPDFNIQTKSSKELHKLNSSLQDLTMDDKEEHLSDLYNEDDENLIESIEREFLLTHDNFLPGQIIN